LPKRKNKGYEEENDFVFIPDPAAKHFESDWEAVSECEWRCWGADDGKSMATNNNRLWTREELIIAFNLYCKIPFGQIDQSNALCFGDERSVALLVLMAALEHATKPKALAKTAKHIAFGRCGELNFCNMVEARIPVLESELLRG
jgi:hypothetical protein